MGPSGRHRRGADIQVPDRGRQGEVPQARVRTGRSRCSGPRRYHASFTMRYNPVPTRLCNPHARRNKQIPLRLWSVRPSLRYSAVVQWLAIVDDSLPPSVPLGGRYDLRSPVPICGLQLESFLPKAGGRVRPSHICPRPSPICVRIQRASANQHTACTIGQAVGALHFGAACERGAQPRCRCGGGEPSPGADVAGVSPVPVQMWRGEPSPGADVAGRAQSRRRCGRGLAPMARGPSARPSATTPHCAAPPSTPQRSVREALSRHTFSKFVPLFSKLRTLIFETSYPNPRRWVVTRLNISRGAARCCMSRRRRRRTSSS